MPDETVDTGFGEMFTQGTIKEQELTLEKSKPEDLPKQTRARAMTKKSLDFRSAMKEKSAKTANKCFHANVTAFHAFLASSNNPEEIEERTKDLITIVDQAELELSTWLELVKLTPVEESVADLVSTVQDVTEDCGRAAFYKITEGDEITSFRPGSSRKSSKMTSASGSSRSSVW